MTARQLEALLRERERLSGVVTAPRAVVSSSTAPAGAPAVVLDVAARDAARAASVAHANERLFGQVAWFTARIASLMDRPEIEWPCRTRISCHHLVWVAL